MAKLKESFVFAGMQRDLSVSKHPTQFLYDAKNIRITARDGDTMLSITNERGPQMLKIANELYIRRKEKEPEFLTIGGNYVAHVLLNQYLVLFTWDADNEHVNRIFRINLDTLSGIELFAYNFGMTSQSNVDVIASYENEGVQKVYWTDGESQPKVINIADSRLDDRFVTTDNRWYPYNEPEHFDFVPTLRLNETVGVKKILGSGGEFAPGVIQYAFTYYYKYGQESNIFYTTPLLYISYGDRGASPEDKVDNVFEITVKHLDTKFDYLRIYSIQRTSINATPICKRVQDIEIATMPKNSDNELYTTFTDTGTIGDIVDPTELLYKGGETITAKTLEQKDNTLFLGSLSIARKSLNDTVYDKNENKTYKEAIEEELRDSEHEHISEVLRRLSIPSPSSTIYAYSSQLNAKAQNTSNDKVSPQGYSVPCGGFKSGETYRLGVQFQYESGKWSEPIFIKDITMSKEKRPDSGYDTDTGYYYLDLPCYKGILSGEVSSKLSEIGYKKVRPVVVFPTMQDRNIVCQGVMNPVIEHVFNREGSSSYQSSWFFRPQITNLRDQIKDNIYCAPAWYMSIPSACPDEDWNPTSSLNNIRAVEIQGGLSLKSGVADQSFIIEGDISTLHSPDIEFDEQLKTTDYAGVSCDYVGKIQFANTLYDMSIQTETPTISNGGSGFVHVSGHQNGSWGLVAGPFYEDFVVDDKTDGSDENKSVKTFMGWDKEECPVKFMVYPWQATGSLNNDVNRPADLGIASAVLKKKILSNLRYATASWNVTPKSTNKVDAQIFYSNELEILKIKDKFYNGNIDTVVNPKFGDGIYMLAGGYNSQVIPIKACFAKWNVDVDTKTEDLSAYWYKTFSKSEKESVNSGMYIWNGSAWEHCAGSIGTDVGDYFVDLVMKKGMVRMKYKSSPHILLDIDHETDFYKVYESSKNDNGGLPIVELTKTVTERYGGISEDALKANVWIPCGEPVVLGKNGCSGKAGEGDSTVFYWSYGDTYYQRYDCLKTYAFTPEDPNQIVEIGSFMLETHVNIDGRYDRNRGQINNLNMSPQNFNLINPVYSQTDNFFSYRILDDDYYKNNEFPNQFTWTKEKQSGADVDLWTNITLASTYDIDGSKGAIKSLNFWKDTIYCFQDKGISRILFNSRVQIPASDGVPIEISNNYKVDGYQYLSDGIGCKNIHLIKETPSGIYFIDSVAGHLFQLGEGLSDITEKCNMTTWFKKKGPSITRVLYDDVHHDVYLPYNDDDDDNVDWTLCFSEKVGQFTGFYSYGNAPLIESYNHRVFSFNFHLYEKKPAPKFKGDLCAMFEGKYNIFFKGMDSNPYVGSEFTFICNGSSNNVVGADKIFTNLEFRASVEGDGELNGETGKFTPTLPLNTIEVWDEYQHGIATLENKSGHSFFEHFMDDGTASLKRKFRIWRCDIPRDNVPINPTTEAPMGIYRKGAVGSRPHRNDRMRNPWLFIKLVKDAPEEPEEGKPEKGNPRIELHDLQVTYFA